VSEALLAVLYGRIRAFFKQGDAAAVLDLDALVDAERLWAAADHRDGTPVPQKVMLGLGLLRWCRYLARSPGHQPDESIADIEEALRWFGLVAQADPQAVPEPLRRFIGAKAAGLAWVQYEGGVATFIQSNRENDAAALDQAIRLLIAAVRGTPADDPDRLRRLESAAASVRVRYERLGAPDDLDQLIDLSRAIVAVTEPDSPERADHLSRLAFDLAIRLDRTDTRTDLDEVIDAAWVAIDVLPSGNRDRAVLLSILATTLEKRFRRTDSLDDLNGVIDTSRALVTAVSSDEPVRVSMLCNLGSALLTRYERGNASADLDDAVAVYQAAVAAAVDAVARADALSMLGFALATRFQRDEKVADLDAAVDAKREAARAAPTDRHRLSDLGAMLQLRFEYRKSPADLQAAIETFVRVLKVTPAEAQDRPTYLSVLLAAMRSWVVHIGASADLDQTVDLYQALVDVTLPGDEHRAILLAGLAGAHAARFSQLGARADLQAAVAADTAALDAVPANHPHRGLYLSSLADRLRLRSECTGQRVDADVAVGVARSAVEAMATDHPYRAEVLGGLRSALYARFERFGAIEDIDAAVAAGRAAIDATPMDNPRRAGYLHGLATTLLLRFERVGSLAASGVDTDLLTGVVESLAALGMRSRVRLDNPSPSDVADLSLAIELLAEAVDATPADASELATFQYALATALHSRHRYLGVQADAEAGARLSAAAAAADTVPVSMRIFAAQQSAFLTAATRGPAAALGGYTAGVRLLPLMAWHGLDRTSQESRLADCEHLVADAVASAAAADAHDQAIELLELGRGVLWSQVLNTGTDLTELRAVAPELAAQLDAAGSFLGRSTVVVDHTRIGTGQVPRVQVADRIRVARRFDALVEEVRQLPSSDRFPQPQSFLRPPQATQLYRAIGDSRVVVLNASQWGCQALIVFNGQVTPVALPKLTPTTMFVEALRHIHTLTTFARSGRTQSDVMILEMALTSTLEWLWDTIAEPVLAATGDTATPADGPAWPRLWWCPVGPLALLPVHAAGYHTDGSGRTLLDRVVSSYAPTLRALANARASRPPAGPGRMLLVTMPKTPGGSPLPHVGRERDAITTLLSAPCTELSGDRATRDAVQTSLPDHNWTHIACHGIQDVKRPSNSGIRLTDGLLSIAQITGNTSIHGEFAFLSACQTAAGSLTNPDEIITLTAALQYAGWRHVIGTMWSVWDDAAADVATRMYPRLIHNGYLDPTHAAAALHHSLRHLRDAEPSQPSRWAPFIHAGP
jgi:tetratricopeptide (TPR) repeat protein